MRCGNEYCSSSLENGCCGACLLSPVPFNFCKSTFRYTSPVNKLIAKFKFNGHFDSGYALSSLLALEIQQYYYNHVKPQLLVPVPLHRSRLKLRGFNQANEIARVVSKQCRISVAHSIITKTRNTLPQTELKSAQARKTNLHNAFAIRREPLLKNVNFVAVIDDVVTTMATITAISKLLKLHGVHRVDVWCLARASREP